MPASPRQVLRRQLDRLAERDLAAYVGTELEFIVFDDSYEQAWNAGYRELTPANQYNVDYSMLGTGRLEPLLRAIRNGMTGAGMYVESAKGECNPGQHEIAFRYDTALSTCDNHSIYKTGAKEIAARHGKSLTFMAKYNEREGNSCHIHISLRGTDGSPVLAGDGDARVLAADGRTSSPASRPRCASSPTSSRRTSTPTSGSRPAASRRRPSRGESTTGRARCGWSATASRCGWRTGCRAAT